MNFLPYDWVAIGYLALTGVLILIFRKNVARWVLASDCARALYYRHWTPDAHRRVFAFPVAVSTGLVSAIPPLLFSI